jgi:hypothetical protein
MAGTAQPQRKTREDYSLMQSEEFSEALHEKLMAEDKGTLVSLLLEHAHEEVSEQYNNEILDEWAADYDDEHGWPLDCCADCGQPLDPEAEPAGGICDDCIEKLDDEDDALAMQDLIHESYRDTL